MKPRAFLDCLLSLDVNQARKLWAFIYPDWPEPMTDEEMLVMLHIARTKSNRVPLRAKQYSREWLAERDRRRVQAAVGIAVRGRYGRSIAILEAMEDAVDRSWRAGIDLDTEAEEVRTRMLAARTKEIGRVT